MHQDKLDKLNKNLSAAFHQNLKIPKNQKLLLAHFGLFYKLFFVFYYLIIVHFMSNALTPLIMVLHGTYRRMFAVSFPLDTSSGEVRPNPYKLPINKLSTLLKF